MQKVPLAASSASSSYWTRDSSGQAAGKEDVVKRIWERCVTLNVIGQDGRGLCHSCSDLSGSQLEILAISQGLAANIVDAPLAPGLLLVSN